MSYKEQLQANNTELNANTLDIQTAIDMVNALPEAKDNSIETVHISLKLDNVDGFNIAYSYVKNGEIIHVSRYGLQDGLDNFSASGTALVAEVDVPKGSQIAICNTSVVSGEGEIYLSVTHVNCSVMWLEDLLQSSVVIYGIEDGATAYVQVQ